MVYFHDRARGVLHNLTAPVSDFALGPHYSWEKLTSDNPLGEYGERMAREATNSRINYILNYNGERLLKGRANGPAPSTTSETARIINSAPEGRFLTSNNAGGTSVTDMNTSYGFTRRHLERKADQLERDAQAKGK